MQIQPIVEEQITELVRIFGNAYPAMNLTLNSEQAQKTVDLIRKAQTSATQNSKYYGAYRDGKLIGGMRFHNFNMNMLSHMIPAGGVGFVAVDLMHKKERVAKEMIQHFILHYRNNHVPLVLLYAFRTDFYHQMGFGFGPKMHQYKLLPARFPKGESKQNLHLLSSSDLEDFKTYYNERLVPRTHGLMHKFDDELRAMFNSERQRILGYRDAHGTLRGHMTFTFKPENEKNFTSNNLHVLELHYELPDALHQFHTFLHSQADQFRYVVFNTQDNDFYHLIPDARNNADEMIPSVYHETNTSGVGLMYRVTDVAEMFKALAAHNFGNQTCRVLFEIEDTFIPEHESHICVHFQDGIGHICTTDKAQDVTVNMSIASFSSLIIGMISFRKLLRYGLTSISDEDYIDTIDRLFYVPEPPVCTTAF